eukprot:TRINITY_DN21606_c0_g1_i5.p1 TRINITY_DN21606_c0_g1~~TRINITY_DN21606_c0_g1_i5.p1  ORF type:complete len:136 (+),score=12.87 TRINITY_DN21606_c0_g1_i5:33-440(+)
MWKTMIDTFKVGDTPGCHTGVLSCGENPFAYTLLPNQTVSIPTAELTSSPTAQGLWVNISVSIRCNNDINNDGFGPVNSILLQLALPVPPPTEIQLALSPTDVTSFRLSWRPSIAKIGRAVQQECRDRSRMPSSA